MKSKQTCKYPRHCTLPFAPVPRQQLTASQRSCRCSTTTTVQYSDTIGILQRIPSMVFYNNSLVQGYHWCSTITTVKYRDTIGVLQQQFSIGIPLVFYDNNSLVQGYHWCSTTTTVWYRDTIGVLQQQQFSIGILWCSTTTVQYRDTIGVLQ